MLTIPISWYRAGGDFSLPRSFWRAEANVRFHFRRRTMMTPWLHECSYGLARLVILEARVGRTIKAGKI